MGPKRVVNTYHIYFVNGYKFHTHEWSQGRTTMNCGVCVTGTGEGEFENEYYGILREVSEIEYPGEPLKKCVLFNCDWFDPTPNRGMRVNKSYGIVEIRHDRRYNKYDPFILAYVATQVYYMSYPQKTRDKLPWWVVIKSKPRSRVDNQYTLPVAYQEDNMSDVNFMADHDVSIENLRRDLGHYEDIDVNILDVSETREEGENDEEEDDEVEAEDEEFEDFISDEDEELAVGDMCLDDSEDEDDDPDSDDE